jgi:hypothetical protein
LEADVNVNQTVKTPIGKGTFQGRFEVRQGGEIVGENALVRLPVNEETSRHLKDSRCVTPQANQSALFVFPMAEIEYA